MASVRLANCQRRDSVPVAWLRRCAQRAVRRLRIRAKGQILICLIAAPAMRRLHARFTGDGTLTDVLSFRYPDEQSVIGEILVAPAAARRYATAHGITYRRELARYVVHGLLHWVGHDDRTVAQQQTMRRMEDRLVAQCAE